MNSDQPAHSSPIQSATHVESKPAGPLRQREISSEELLAGQQEIAIRHGEEVYRLRVTRNGKLILHK